MNDDSPLARRVNRALEGADPKVAARVREVLADYTPGDRAGAVILLATLEVGIGEQAALAALGMHPPRPGLVYCCATKGWVTPAERFDHVWDSYSGTD
jgi:hypothetical protein